MGECPVGTVVIAENWHKMAQPGQNARVGMSQGRQRQDDVGVVGPQGGMRRADAYVRSTGRYVVARQRQDDVGVVGPQGDKESSW